MTGGRVELSTAGLVDDQVVLSIIREEVVCRAP
jgi:hypothetical protein